MEFIVRRNLFVEKRQLRVDPRCRCRCAGKTAFDVCKNEETTLALPGGFSRLKGEKTAWKEKDPTGYATHRQELAVRVCAMTTSRCAREHACMHICASSIIGHSRDASQQCFSDTRYDMHLALTHIRPSGRMCKHDVHLA
jgi:hypothetical protein